jgi:hypothetical protein
MCLNYTSKNLIPIFVCQSVYTFMSTSRLRICLSVCLSVCMYVFMYVCMSAFLSTFHHYLSVCLLDCLRAGLSPVSISTYLSISPPVHSSVCPSVPPPKCPSGHPSVYIFACKQKDAVKHTGERTRTRARSGLLVF